MKVTKQQKSGPTDQQLAAKYDTGEPANLEDVLKKMAKTSRLTAKSKLL